MSAEDGRGARRTRVLAILLFVASAAYFASYALVGLYDDEGYLLEGVTRVLDGQVIYRDFHHTYAPGRFYLFAALFKVFGEDLVVVRATWVALRALIVVLAWLLARRLVAGPLAWAPPLALLAVPGPWHKSFFHLFLVATTLAGVSLFERGGRGRSFAAGVVLGLALLFRQDVGIAASCAFGLVLAAEGLRARRGGAAAPGVSVPLLAAGLAALLAPAIAYFTAERALGPLISKVLLAGLRDNRANELPFPSLLPIVPPGAPDSASVAALLSLKALYYVPPATFAGYGVFLLLRSIRRRALPLPREALLLLLGGSALLQVAARSDIPHLLQAIGMVYFVWAIALAGLARRAPARASSAVAAALALAIPAALSASLALVSSVAEGRGRAGYLQEAGVIVPHDNATGSRLLVREGPREWVHLPHAQVLVTPEEAAGLREIGQFLDERTKPGDYILSIPGFQLVYFLFDRKNPTAFPHVRRAFDTPEEEASYIADIDRRGTRYILFSDWTLDVRHPERRFSVYANTTMDWITEHYQPVKRIGGFLVLERIGGAT
jgi:hypothetical protein